MRLPVALLLLCLASCAVLPPRGELSMREVKLPSSELRYASGLRVLVEQDTRQPVVAVVTLVGSGSSQDPPGQEGLAHLVEHLTFRARADPLPSRVGQLEAAGAGRINATTTFDFTSYEEIAPRESLEELLRIEAERLTHPLAGLTPELFDVERGVVRNELRQQNETGFVGQVFSSLQQACFPENHPYARPITGAHESLAALTLAQAEAFARQHYRPDNTTLVLTGDVDPSTVASLLARVLPASLRGQDLPPVPLRPRRPAAPPPVPLNPHLEFLEHQAAVPTPELYLGWTLPRGDDDASVFHDFVQRTLPTQLAGALREDGDIAGVSASLIPGQAASLLVVRVVLRSGEHPRKSADFVLGQLYHLWEGQTGAERVLALEAQVRRQRITVLTELALEDEDVLTRAVRRARLTHFTLDPQADARARDAVALVEAAPLSRFTYQYLQRERARQVMVWPAQGALGQTPGGPGPTPLSVEEDVLTRVPLTPFPPVEGMRTLHLDNGLEVVLGARPGLPLASVTVWLHGGSATGEPLGVAQLADNIAFPGSTFQGTPADYGLRPRGTVYADHVVFSLSGAAGNLPNMLALTAEQLSSMKTNDASLHLYRLQMLPYVEKAETRPEFQAARALRTALHAGHPYGRVAIAADLERLGTREVKAWLERTYRPANAVVAVVGEFSLDEAEKQVRASLASWRGPPGAQSPPPPAPPAPPRAVQLPLHPQPRRDPDAGGLGLPPAPGGRGHRGALRRDGGARRPPSHPAHARRPGRQLRLRRQQRPVGGRQRAPRGPGTRGEPPTAPGARRRAPDAHRARPGTGHARGARVRAPAGPPGTRPRPRHVPRAGPGGARHPRPGLAAGRVRRLSRAPRRRHPRGPPEGLRGVRRPARGVPARRGSGDPRRRRHLASRLTPRGPSGRVGHRVVTVRALAPPRAHHLPGVGLEDGAGGPRRAREDLRAHLGVLQAAHLHGPVQIEGQTALARGAGRQLHATLRRRGHGLARAQRQGPRARRHPTTHQQAPQPEPHPPLRSSLHRLAP